MSIVDKRPSGRIPVTPERIAAMADGPIKSLLLTSSAVVKHDYPACAIFRGGKCSCDEADKLCPRCGSEEWDRVDSERGRERDVPFNHCARCDNEWDPVNQGASKHGS